MIHNPQALYGLWGCLGIVILALTVFLYQRRNIHLLGLDTNNKKIFTYRFIQKWVLILFAVLGLVLAQADISVGKRIVRRTGNGLDIVFVLDVSHSMLAQDLVPNRLGVAINFAHEIIYNTPTARFGLVLFKGQPLVVSPLTYDTNYLINVLSQAHPRMLTSTGTNLAGGLMAASKLFPQPSSYKKIIILLSDGGTLSGDLLQAMHQLSQDQLPVFVIGMGGTEPISLLDNNQQLIMQNNKPINVALEQAPLMSIARHSFGQYWQYSSNTLPEVLAQLKPWVNQGNYIDYEPYNTADFFAIISLVSLILFLFRGNKYEI